MLYNAENWAALSPRQIENLKGNKTNLLSYMVNAPIEIVQQKTLKFLLGEKKHVQKLQCWGTRAISFATDRV